MVRDSSDAPVAALWREGEMARCADDLERRALSSRWIGSDPVLALFGGGNTSMKSGDGVLHVKGSGSDLALVAARDFTPIALAPAAALLDGPDLDNDGLAAALAPLKREATAPKPSIETLMHAALPFRYVEHTHADSVLALLNTASGERLARQVYGSAAPLVPFRHSGFDLARACLDVFRARRDDTTVGLLLHFHGIVAFGDTGRDSFDHMVSRVRRAESYLKERGAWTLPTADVPPRSWAGARRLASLRRSLSSLAGFPVALHVVDSPETVAYACRADLDRVALQGPPTPQHAVFTKRLPCLGLDAEAYATAYRAYLREYGEPYAPSTHPDPAPRVLLDPAFGLVTCSVDGQHARMTATVFRHDIAISSRASAHDEYVSLPPDAVLAGEVHYGGFDRARLQRRRTDLPLLGCVVGVTGEAPPATLDALRPLGADVVALGISEHDCLDAIYRTGGLDVLVDTPGNPPAPTALLDLLPLSPAGGWRGLPDIDALRAHWVRATGVP